MPNPEFIVEGHTSWKQLEAQIRSVELLHTRDGEAVHPYADAAIRLEDVAYSDVRPMSLYVLRKNLALQTEIINSIAGEGLHPLELDGAILLGREGEQTGLIPPIVEESEEAGMYVLDGSHRTNMGRWAGRTTFRAIHISDVRPDCPAYAFPNEWDEVAIREAVPERVSDRKHYREGDYYTLYRNFGPLNGSRPRPQ